MMLFAAGMTVMAVGYWIKSHSVFSEAAHQIFFRYFHITLISFLSFIVFPDYKRQSETVKRFKVSKFHTSGRVGEWINGFLLQVDLKKSKEMARRLTALNGDREIYGKLVRKWYDYFTADATALGGEILSEAGDAISIFFEDKSGLLSLDDILKATATMIETHDDLAAEFSLDLTINLRGSIVYGALQPCWKGQGASSRAGWDGNILIESGTLLELESAVPGNKDKSVVVVSAESSQKALVVPGVIDSLVDDLIVLDKDEVEHRISAFRVSSIRNKTGKVVA